MSSINHHITQRRTATRYREATLDEMTDGGVTGVPRLAGPFTRPCVRPATASQRCDFDSPHGLSAMRPQIRSHVPVAGPRKRLMNIITETQYAELLANGIAARDAARAGLDFDPKPVVKLFTPHWYARWLLAEIDPEYPQRAFGLCDSGDGRPYVGYVSLRDLDDVHGKFKFTVAADPHFGADKPLSVYADVAYTRGLIVT
jgi:hypothetical protein